MSNEMHRSDLGTIAHAPRSQHPASAPVPSGLNGRLIDAGTAIRVEPTIRIDFLHSLLCQIGLPRRRTPDRVFERRNGHASILVEAGSLWDGSAWVEQPLPYGATARLIMVHISSEAIRTRCRTVEIGESTRQFLTQLGMRSSGGRRGSYAALKRQMQAIAACRLTLGMQSEGRTVTLDAKPIRRFDAWLHQDGWQCTLWPGTLELSQEFYDTLIEHAVPLDPRALAALKHSSLALDIYAWLAHRLRRVNTPNGVRLSWRNLYEQFGQEYANGKDFKTQFRHAMRQTLAVYPDARVAAVIGGIMMYPSLPPVH
jgi:hypothetical protein